MAKNPSEKHQKLVLAQIKAFRSEGHSILYAAYTGFSEPNKHGRHEPDIVTKDSNGILHLTEVKLKNDFYSQTTEEQFLDFSSRVMKNTNTTVPFHIIVYQEDESELREVLSNLGLSKLIDSAIIIWTL